MVCLKKKTVTVITIDGSKNALMFSVSASFILEK